MQGATGAELTDVLQFQYRSFCMGFRHIELEASEVIANGVNFMLQFRNDTLQSILTSEYGLDPVYKYLYGEALHIRVRSCSASFAYYNNPDFLCYDSCPDRTYPVEPDSDISKFYC